MTMSQGCEIITKKAKSYIENKGFLDEWFGGQNKNYGVCPSARYLDGYKDDKRAYRKVIPCGRECCDVCGQEGSLLHRQRFARGFSKIAGVKSLGYFVFTFPVEVRGALLEVSLLSEFQTFIGKLLTSYSWCGGWVSRWHWGGEKSKCWHPHLNVLVSGVGWLEYEVIQDIKERARVWVCENIVLVNDVVVEYRYCSNVKQRVHRWRYVCRPTLLLTGGDMWLLNLIGKLHNFRNTRWSRSGWIKLQDKIDNKGLDIFNDKSIKWVYKGYFKDVEYETLEEWSYKGYGIFEYPDTS